MASEIRVDKINSLSGVGTVTLSPTGVDIAGITTAATLRATTGIVTTLTSTTGNITTLRAPTGIVTTFTADTARINTTSLASTKLSIQSTATSGSGTACGLRVGNNVSGALTKYPAEVEIRTTGVENHNAIRTDAGDGNGGFTAGVQGYNGFLNLTTGGTDVVGVKLSADGNTNFFTGNNQLAANVGIGTTVVGSATNLTLGRRDTGSEGGELGFCRSNDGTQYWQIDCFGSDNSPALRLHNSGATKVAFPAGGGIAPSGELTAANVLGDYEFATWTPTFRGDSSDPTQSYATQNGLYVKVGNLVYCEFDLQCASSGISAGSGYLKLGGLPFPKDNSLQTYGISSSFGFSTNLSTSHPTAAYLAASTSTLYLMNPTNSQGISYCSAAHVTNSSRVLGGFTYRTNL